MNDPIRRLPDAELEVMQALWACPTPATRSDIESALFPHHPMATTTLPAKASRMAHQPIRDSRFFHSTMEITATNSTSVFTSTTDEAMVVMLREAK